MRWRTANTRRKRTRYECTFAIVADDGVTIVVQRTFTRPKLWMVIRDAADWAMSLRADNVSLMGDYKPSLTGDA